MSFNHSDIYSAYTQIMLDKGIVKSAEKKEVSPSIKEEKAFKSVAEASKELKKYKDSDYPRAGSDTIKVIENLYNTKAERPKSQEYKHNIMEIAHPNKVILNPAYDKINALIENNNERQRILINITQKPVNGLLTQHKYAEADLTKSLVSIANDLDNRHINELRILADECLAELHKKATMWDDVKKMFEGGGAGEEIKDIGKGVGAGAEIGGVIGGLVGAFGGPVAALGGAWTGSRVGAVLGGVLSSIFNTSPQAKNVAINAQEAKEKLAALIEDHKSDLLLTKLDTALSQVIQTAGTYSTLVDEMHMNNNDPGAKRSAASIAITYTQQIDNLEKFIPLFLTNAKMGRYAAEESDVWSKIKSPFESLFGDKVHDAIEAFEVLEKVNKTALEGIKSAQTEAASAKSDATFNMTDPENMTAPTKEQGMSDASRMEELQNYLSKDL